jgi:hypothetical protein
MAETEPTAAARRTDRRERPDLVPDRERMVVCSIVAAMVCCPIKYTTQALRWLQTESLIPGGRAAPSAR